MTFSLNCSGDIVIDLQQGGDDSQHQAPNGLELSCLAARAPHHPFSRNSAGKSPPNFPHASRVSCSELLGSPEVPGERVPSGAGLEAEGAGSGHDFLVGDMKLIDVIGSLAPSKGRGACSSPFLIGVGTREPVPSGVDVDKGGG